MIGHDSESFHSFDSSGILSFFVLNANVSAITMIPTISDILNFDAAPEHELLLFRVGFVHPLSKIIMFCVTRGT